jgi:hypothetical protein
MNAIRYISLTVVSVALIGLGWQTPRAVTLEDVKANRNCIEYQGQLGWQKVEDTLGEPAVFPRPEPGKLSDNTRVYKNATVIFYVTREKRGEGNTVRFHEVVQKIEICLAR